MNLPHFNFPLLSKYKLPLVGVLLFTLSTLTFYQVLNTNTKVDNLNSKLSSKEALVASLSARAKSLLYS